MFILVKSDGQVKPAPSNLFTDTLIPERIFLYVEFFRRDEKLINFFTLYSGN